MVAISVSVEGLMGLNWSRWERLVTAVEELGFAGLFCSDHFVLWEPIETDSLELIVALTYLAEHTKRVHFGPLVSPLSFRDPIILARQAIALDNLSRGRMILGVGAGWLEREHTMFGYDLGDIPTRMTRLEEGLVVLKGLVHTDEPFTYKGQFYRLHEAVLLPRSQQPGSLPIMVGGSGPKLTLPIVARYADIWNALGLTPDEFRKRSDLLDKLLHEVGRKPNEVKRTLTIPIYCGRDSNELEQRVSGLRIIPSWANLPLETMLESLLTTFTGSIVGPPDRIVEHIRHYAEAGVEELIIQWFCLDDIEGLQLFAEQVLPHFAN